MKTLNLVDESKSDIKYKPSNFPDGQQNITIINTFLGITPPPIQIKSRLNNWRDLELIACAVASLKELDVEKIHLYAPYILGARSDRKFEIGGNNYLKDVICPAINALGCKTVTVLDPHSDCLEMGIKGFKKQSNEELVKWVTRELYGAISEKGPNSQYPCVLISPDKGASHKIYKLAEQIGYKGDVIECSKERDAEGKLTKCVVPIKFNYGKDYIIIDDICDGGATFINIAKALKDQLYKMDNQMFTQHPPKIYLIVTHGIFSKGFSELQKYFDGIYCTNSYKDLSNDHQYQGILSDDFGNNSKDFIKQLNIF